MNIISIVLFLVIIIACVIVYNEYSKKYSPTIYKFINDKSNNNINLLIIAGVHGNERAGPYTLNELIKKKYFENRNFKTITVIPIVNIFGYKYNIRYQNNIFHPDINRSFYNETTDPLAKLIIEHVKNSDIILDFHEGYDYYLQDKNSIGSTISVTKDSKVAQNILEKLNESIHEKNKIFTLLRKNCNIKNSLQCYAYTHYPNKLYMLIETTGQNEIQPMKVRYNQIKIILDGVIRE
jgi:hypothetical protein